MVQLPINRLSPVLLLLPKQYRISQQQLITMLLPSLLRRPRMIAWLGVLLSPLLKLYGQFAQHVASTTRELSYNGQAMMLEKALNDRFDPAFTRIKILNSDAELSPLYLNFVSEDQPLPITYFNNEGQPLLHVSGWREYSNQLGFIVRAPQVLGSQQAALQAYTQQLKLALIRYKIVYV